MAEPETWPTDMATPTISTASRPTVLLVDDCHDALHVWSLFLALDGFEVPTAADGAAALAEMARRLPDVAVLDLELPGVSGFQVAREIRQRPISRDLPLIAATGYSSPRQLDAAWEAGFDAVMVKPCDPAALVAEIRRLLAERHAGTS
jgi:CheY-like chemotaxis protein